MTDDRYQMSYLTGNPCDGIRNDGILTNLLRSNAKSEKHLN
jgi:hypothetical protein